LSHLRTDGGVSLRFSDRGEGAPAFVLVHGWKGSHRLWDPTVARLSETNRVVSYDLRGMGESAKPRGTYDFDQHADDLEFVLAELELRDVVLVAWSMGTTVSLRYLQRGGERVAALVIVNGPLRLTRAPDFPHAMSEAELERYLAELREHWPAGERAFQSDTLLEPDAATVDWLYSIALQTPLDVALRVVREQAKLDLRGALAALRIPVLAAYSRHDPYYPPSLAEHIAASAHDGRSVIFEHSAHCIPIEEPERFCDELRRFASELDGALA
jgi:non-heme chloroperoxidase